MSHCKRLMIYILRLIYQMFDNIVLFRPVRWERSKDWRLTQERGEDPQYYSTHTVRPYHLWLDYAWPASWVAVPVYSAHAWKVRTWYDEKWFWNFIEVISSDWYSTFYCHLQYINKEVVTWLIIPANFQLWMMWNTGLSRWVHLHFWLKITWDKSAVKWRSNPTKYIKDWQNTTPATKTDEIKTDEKPASTLWDLSAEDISAVMKLQEDKIFSWELWQLDKRMLVIVARIYNKLKQ